MQHVFIFAAPRDIQFCKFQIPVMINMSVDGSLYIRENLKSVESTAIRIRRKHNRPWEFSF